MKVEIPVLCIFVVSLINVGSKFNPYDFSFFPTRSISHSFLLIQAIRTYLGEIQIQLIPNFNSKYGRPRIVFTEATILRF
uniref:Uncharacterized protein n=1 Tax=Solanum tuberosum TaxID=4113 RepID=M1D5R3_SOLTU